MASLLGGNYLPTEYQSFIHMSRYSRWIADENRRESWSETVNRLVSFFKENVEGVDAKSWEDMEEAILSLQVMPSMR